MNLGVEMLKLQLRNARPGSIPIGFATPLTFHLSNKLGLRAACKEALELTTMNPTFSSPLSPYIPYIIPIETL